MKRLKLPRPGLAGLPHLWKFIRLLAQRFRQERCTDMASSLTFTTLLSVVPLITIMVTFFSAFPQFSEYSQQVRNLVLQNMLPETGGRIITQYMEQFAENATRLTTMGIAFLAVTAMMLIYSIDSSFNKIWRVRRQRSVVQRILVYWAVLTLAPLLVGGSLSLTSWLIRYSVGNLAELTSFELSTLKLLPVLLSMIAFTFIFRVVPNRYVPLHHAFIGGVVSAIAFEIMSRAFAAYIAHVPTYKLVYGAFAMFPIFLLWVFLSWMVVLLGAVLAASISHWRSKNGELNLAPELRLYYALCALRLMSEGLQNGETYKLPLLSRKLLLGYDLLEELLEKMLEINVVQRVVGQRWVMVRSPEHIQVLELYRLFVFNPDKPPTSQDCAGINSWLSSLAEHNARDAAVDLHTLFNDARIAR